MHRDTSIDAAVARITSGRVRHVDVGCVTLRTLQPTSGGQPQASSSGDACGSSSSAGAVGAPGTVCRYFINIASAGASAAALQLAPWYNRWLRPLCELHPSLLD